jgi:hypothetical protein
MVFSQIPRGGRSSNHDGDWNGSLMTRWDVLDEREGLVASYRDAAEAVAALNLLRHAGPASATRATAVAFDDDNVRIPGAIFQHIVRLGPE